MPRKTLMTGAALLAALAIAPAASAATISYEGTTLVYTGTGSEVNDVIASAGYLDGHIRFHEYAGATIGGAADHCEELYGSYECETPVAMKVVLGAGDDEFSLFSDFPDAVGVTMLGGDGNDTLEDDYSANAGRRFEGGPGNDKLTAYKGDDVVLGDDGNDKVYGGAGADEVRGGAGDDELEGDKYEDPSADVIDGGAGFDIIEEYSDPENDIHPPATVTQNGVADDGRPGENDNVTGVEKITSHVNGTFEGTEGADDLWIWSNMAGGDSTIRGLGGNDKLTSLDYSETIDGGAGDDTIQAGFGNDVVTGGPGKDKINSDGGSYCGWYECNVPFGDDTVYARDGEADQVECGIGNDTVEADTIDQVAPSCEKVNTTSTPPVKVVDDNTAKPTPGQGAAAAVKLVGKPRIGGLTFSVQCAAACQVAGTLVAKGKKIGTGKKTLIAAGKATVKVKVARKFRKARKLSATLKVTVKSPGGTSKLSKKVTLRR
jgi:Ca2+-binding RTX toxin-like protein